MDKYEYKGLFCGIVPIRFNFEDDGLGIDIQDNWFSPPWLLDFVSDVWEFVAGCVGWEGGWSVTNVKKVE